MVADEVLTQAHPVSADGKRGASQREVVAPQEFAVLDPLVPVLICGIVRELNGRSRGASAAEWITPDPPRASGASLSRGALCGCGCGRDYRRCCGAH